MSLNESVHDIPTLINQFLATADDELKTFERYSHELALLIAGGELSLLQFIQYLGPTLTSETDSVRSKAVQCLSSTFQDLDKTKLSKQDIHVVIQFLIAKLDDKASVIHVLQGLNAVITFNNFIPSVNDNLKTLLNAVVDKYDPKAHLAKVRFETFQMLKIIFTRYLSFLQGKEAEKNLFVKAFIHIAAGEKDPRNLVASFTLNTSINEHLEFDPSSELHQEFFTDLFDVCFCYFPISFTPPANDPYKISANDLKVALRKTISSQSYFAKDSFPSLFEKLTSTNPVVRNDVLQTLLSCVETYNGDTILEYWLTIWDSLKFEILHNDPSVFKSHHTQVIPENYQSNIDDSDDKKSLFLTLDILQRLVIVMQEAGQLDNYLTAVTNELAKDVSTINDKSFKQSVILLSALASVSSVSYNFILKHLFSTPIWGKYIRSDAGDDEEIEEVPSSVSNQDTEIDINELDSKQSEADDIILNVSKQRELIDNFGFILSAYNEVSSREPKFAEEDNALKYYKDHLLIFMGQLLQTSSNLEKTLKCKVIQQLIKLITLQGLLNSQEYSLIFGWLNENLNASINYDIRNWESDLVLTEIINGLILIMTDAQASAKIDNAVQNDTSLNNNVTFVIDSILPTMLSYLDDVESTNSFLNFPKILNLITRLCVNYQFLEVLTIRLLNKLDSFGQLNIPQSERLTLYKDVIDCLISAFKKTQSVNQFLTNSWYKTFVPRFLNIISKVQDYSVIELGGILIGLIVKFIEKSKHQSILNDFVGAFVKSDQKVGFSVQSVTSKPTIHISLFNSILSNIDKRTSLDDSLGYPTYDLINSVSQFCYTNVKDDSDEYLRIGYLQNLALLVNKFTKQHDDFNKEALSRSVEQISTFCNTKEELTQQQVEAFEVFIWTLKALVLRSDKFGFEFINQLIDWLVSPNSQFGALVAESFNIIMADLPIFTNQLSREPGQKSIVSGVNNLNVRLLYKQQIFEIILPQLIKHYDTGVNQETQLNSLSIILRNISTTILKPHLEQISPLILSGLNVNNTTILDASLNTFDILIKESPELIRPRLSSLVPKLVNLATTKTIVNKELINNEGIRLSSLKALMSIFTTMELQNVVPFQKAVINSLEIALDDKKRSVRKQASDLRQALYELGRS